MTTNLRKSENGYQLKFDCEKIIEMFQDYTCQSLWEFIEKPPPNMSLHVVKAEFSTRWTPDITERLEAISSSCPQVHQHVLKNSGHWVNVDNPVGLMQLFDESFVIPPSPSFPLGN
eukprot:TRINITY_DN1670_c0_g2_i11.p2 TRINITY_DN1670_c0_g2~~TRINITY_DN1670_c0_g2_i11.p2  ORF type:complete len:116 (+),score=26.53 TRINITY_DN1670_c0_g2_i11:699-1046(+)